VLRIWHGFGPVPKSIARYKPMLWSRTRKEPHHFPCWSRCLNIGITGKSLEPVTFIGRNFLYYTVLYNVYNYS
jgi:hypothetical protein